MNEAPVILAGGEVLELAETPGAEVTEVVMSPGEYWIGDPCYAVPESSWSAWLEAANYRVQGRILIGEVEGHWVLGVRTLLGDGVYEDEQGRAYPVDAGLIGLTPVDYGQSEPFGSHRVAFAQPPRCRFSDGIIYLGDVRIDTN